MSLKILRFLRVLTDRSRFPMRLENYWTFKMRETAVDQSLIAAAVRERLATPIV